MNINFWLSSRGRPLAADFILEQGGEEALRLQMMLETVEKSSFQVLLQTKHLKKLVGEKNLYELRIRIKRIQYRFTCHVQGGEIWLLEGMKKQRSRLADKYLVNARMRSDILHMQLKSQR